MSAKYSGPIDFAKDLVSAIKTDPMVTSAISGEFPGKTLKYFIGLDDQKLPSSDDCPHLAFMPGDYQIKQMSGVRMAEKSCNLQCSLVISSGDKPEPDSGGMTSFKGLEKLERIVPVIIQAMQPMVLELGKYGKFGPINTEIAFPLFRASWTIEAVDEY